MSLSVIELGNTVLESVCKHFVGSDTCISDGAAGVSGGSLTRGGAGSGTVTMESASAQC